MKATIYDEVELIVDVKSGFTDKTIQKGTKGVIVECYSEPREGYAVDLRIPNETLVDGYGYENAILFPDQFVVSVLPVQEQRGDFSAKAIEAVGTEAPHGSGD
jgi:hypothetical protein